MSDYRLLVAPAAVARAIKTLLERRIHPTFTGYLCVKRDAHRVGRDDGLRPDFTEFHDTFLAVPGGPAGRPYYRPFWDESRSSTKAWYQRNVAGTYSPASAARIPTFTSVIEITGKLYQLRPKHWELAREHMTFGGKVPVLPLALFLYRDYGLNFDLGAAPQRLIGVFLDEFGYAGEERQAEFEHLFSTDGFDGDPSEYFQEAS